MKKSNLSDFKNIRKGGIIAIKIEEGDHLIDCKLTGGQDEIVLITHEGMSIRFHEEEMRDQGRDTVGVWGIRRTRATTSSLRRWWKRMPTCWWPAKTASASRRNSRNTACRAVAEKASSP